MASNLTPVPDSSVTAQVTEEVPPAPDQPEVNERKKAAKLRAETIQAETSSVTTAAAKLASRAANKNKQKDSSSSEAEAQE